MSITIIDQKIESAYRCSIRWKCSVRKVLYFKVYRGLNPSGMQLLATTSDTSIGNISLKTIADSGEVYIKIEAISGDNNLLSELTFRITAGDVETYLKYRKHFEDNFYKASLQKAAGTYVAILQRKFTGVPCTACSNPISGECEDSSCTVCYGTGFEGGFYTPIISPALRGPTQEQEISDTERAALRVTQGGLIFPAYPKLYKHDYLIDLANYTFYEVMDQGRQVMKFDHQRLGSTVYQVIKLPVDHPVVSNFKIEKVLTSIISVELTSNGMLTLTGIKMIPNFGRMDVSINNEDHADPITYDAETYYFEDLYSIKSDALQFEIDSRFYGQNCTYKVTLNNLSFEGDVING